MGTPSCFISGKMATDANGNVSMDYLPAPVLGTFWPYSAEKNVKLSAVTASQRKVLVDRTAISLRELIEANVGAQVTVTETNPGAPVVVEMPRAAGGGSGLVEYAATIIGVPAQSGEELEATSPPYSGEKLTVKGNIVLMKRQDGSVKVVNIDRIVDITFKGEHKDMLPREEMRNLMTLKLDWPEGKPQKEAEVGLMYVQKGIRWIPEYKVTIDGKGSAAVKLQATLINELADVSDVTCAPGGGRADVRVQGHGRSDVAPAGGGAALAVLPRGRTDSLPDVQCDH